MDSAALDLAFKAAMALSQLATFVYVRNANRNDEVDKRFARVQEIQEEQSEKLSLCVGHLSQRLAHLEAAVEAAPNHGDLAKLYQSVNGLSETVNQLVGESRGQSDTLRLILNQVMQKGMA